MAYPPTKFDIESYLVDARVYGDARQLSGHVAKLSKRFETLVKYNEDGSVRWTYGTRKAYMGIAYFLGYEWSPNSSLVDYSGTYYERLCKMSDVELANFVREEAGITRL